MADHLVLENNLSSLGIQPCTTVPDVYVGSGDQNQFLILVMNVSHSLTEQPSQPIAHPSTHLLCYLMPYFNGSFLLFQGTDWSSISSRFNALQLRDLQEMTINSAKYIQLLWYLHKLHCDAIYTNYALHRNRILAKRTRLVETRNTMRQKLSKMCLCGICIHPGVLASVCTCGGQRSSAGSCFIALNFMRQRLSLNFELNH